MSNPYLTVRTPRHRRYSANDEYAYAKSDLRVKHVHFGGETIINPRQKRSTVSDEDFRASLSDSEQLRHSYSRSHRRSSSAHDEQRKEPAYHSQPRSSSRPPSVSRQRHTEERLPLRRPSYSHRSRQPSSPAPPPQYYSLPSASATQTEQHNDIHQSKYSSHHHHDSDHRHYSPSRKSERREPSPPIRYTYINRGRRPEHIRELSMNYR
nr:hypothetical protein CFP56_00674 [Quercus suber]